MYNVDRYQTLVVGEKAMVALGCRLGQILRLQVANRGVVVYLEGDLGAGKTTLSRGILEACGHSGAVKSPTYTLVEPYELEALTVYHFDLYRLGDPEELEYLGIRDYFSPQCLCLLEWAERGRGFLPDADLKVTVRVDGSGRNVCIESNTELGQTLMNNEVENWRG